MMRYLLIWMALLCQSAWGSDACSTRAIHTAADVTVSDGSSFATRSFFHSAHENAIRHIDDTERTIAVEGPLSWAANGDTAQLGSDFHKLFALGHQFHAFFLHFDDIVPDAQLNDAIDFDGEHQRGRSGTYPYGGTVHIIDGTVPGQAAGMLFEFPESITVGVRFSDWRTHGGRTLPFRAEIDDGERTFDYHYTMIELAEKSPLWYFDAVAEPPLDTVSVYRLHRKLLAAHCMGNAELMAHLSADEIISANNGSLERFSNDAVRERFTALFQGLDYTGYHDLTMPIIEVAESGDLGWIGVNVRAVGADKSSDATFDHQWAWVMLVRKIDGAWLHIGNASNVAR